MHRTTFCVMSAPGGGAVGGAALHVAEAVHIVRQLARHPQRHVPLVGRVDDLPMHISSVICWAGGPPVGGSCQNCLPRIHENSAPRWLCHALQLYQASMHLAGRRQHRALKAALASHQHLAEHICFLSDLRDHSPGPLPSQGRHCRL